RGAKVVYEKVSEIHVSGHASQGELTLLLNTVKPKYFIPIHGEYRHLVQHIDLARKVGILKQNTILAENGDVITFKGNKTAKKTGKVESGRVYIDGKGVGDVSNLVIRDRKHLSQDGMVVAMLLISKENGDIMHGPEIFSSGLLLENENLDLMERAKATVIETFNAIPLEAKQDFAEVKTEVRRCLRRLFNKQLSRKPVIFPIIVEI
ncbi:MBL fold metallo-hydrolase RNA specificity domain-containing protein, partial [Thermodesulfobacteriota bacterium]